MKKPKILVLGSQGMVGHVVFAYFKELTNYDTHGLARSVGEDVSTVLDVRDFKNLEDYLKQEKFDYVINCIGVLIQSSEKNKSDAILLNSYLPNFLAECGLQYGYKLIHISTDCVFSGREGSYTETSECDGYSTYARTKILGEIANEKDLTIRTSVIGPELKSYGEGLLNWFLTQKDEISGYSNVFWTGVTTYELAKALVYFIEENVSGIFQLVPDHKISKYELLQIAKTIFQKNITIHKSDEYYSDKSLIPTSDFPYKVNSYQVMMKELKTWMEAFGYSYLI